MMHFREATEEDIDAIIDLYLRVARDSGGIVRSVQEITEPWVAGFVKRSCSSGIIIVAVHPEDDKTLIAEVHGYTSGVKAFSHVLTDVTLLVDPDFQGKRIGRTILGIFLNEITANRRDIGKVELMARESNGRAIGLYQSMGFRVEGRLEMRIKNSAGQYEADIPMGWQNPNFEFD